MFRDGIEKNKLIKKMNKKIAIERIIRNEIEKQKQINQENNSKQNK
jgi:hypothetical protein